LAAGGCFVGVLFEAEGQLFLRHTQFSQGAGATVLPAKYFGSSSVGVNFKVYRKRP
jgi:hypothetical protein